MKHIELMWHSYRQMIPAEASLSQHIETRRAFYAGAKALQSIMLNQTSDEPEMTEADERLIEGLDAELQAFADEIKAGRA